MQIYIWAIAEKMGRTAEPITHHPSNREIFTMQNLQVFFCQKKHQEDPELTWQWQSLHRATNDLALEHENEK